MASDAMRGGDLDYAPELAEPEVLVVRVPAVVEVDDRYAARVSPTRLISAARRAVEGTPAAVS